MARLLYWLIYNFDLGPLGPSLLDLAVKTWLRPRSHRRGTRAGVSWSGAPSLAQR